MWRIRIRSHTQRSDGPLRLVGVARGQVLARRYAAEEQAALQAQSPAKPAAGEGGAGGAEAAAWLRRNGLDLSEWGLDDDGPKRRPAGGAEGEADPLGDVDRIVARLKAAR